MGAVHSNLSYYSHVWRCGWLQLSHVKRTGGHSVRKDTPKDLKVATSM